MFTFPHALYIQYVHMIRSLLLRCIISFKISNMTLFMSLLDPCVFLSTFAGVNKQEKKKKKMSTRGPPFVTVWSKVQSGLKAAAVIDRWLGYSVCLANVLFPFVFFQDYKPEEDPALFHSVKTGRGPLGPEWKVPDVVTGSRELLRTSWYLSLSSVTSVINAFSFHLCVFFLLRMSWRQIVLTCVRTNWSLSSSDGGVCRPKWKTSSTG